MQKPGLPRGSNQAILMAVSAALLYLTEQGWRKRSGAMPAEQLPVEQPPLSDTFQASVQVNTDLDCMLFSTLSDWDFSWSPGCIKVLSVGAGGWTEEVAAHLDGAVYDVRQVGSAEDMMTVLQELTELPDVILLRVALPGMDGLQACQTVRHTWTGAQLPIIIIAPANREEDVVRALQAGANDSISSPLRHQELKARIHTQLALTRGVALAKEANTNLELLRSILPQNIITRLKTSSVIADFHPEVTFLFSDIKDFTVMASTWPTQRLISMLNTMFSAFDDICEQFGVFKVETIGDAYFIVSGVHDDGNGDHAYRMMAVAAAMLQAVEKMAWGWEADEPIIKIRIGVHTGPAHSGVVGKTRPRYCFFASRLESNGFPGTIHVSDATRKAVQDWQEIQQLAGGAEEHQWAFISLGARQLKGRGLMVTHLVNVGDVKQALAEFTENESPSPTSAARGISSLVSGHLGSSGSERTGNPQAQKEPTIRSPAGSAAGQWGILDLSNSRSGRTDSGLTDTDLLPLLPTVKPSLSEPASKLAKSPLSISWVKSWTIGSSKWCPIRSQPNEVHAASPPVLRRGHSAEPMMPTSTTLNTGAHYAPEEQPWCSSPSWPAADSSSSAMFSGPQKRVLSSEHQGSSVVPEAVGALDVKLNSLRDEHVHELLTHSSSTNTTKVGRTVAGSRSKTVCFLEQDASNLGGQQAHLRRPTNSVDLSRAAASSSPRTQLQRRHSLHISSTDANNPRAELELLSLYDSLVGDLM